MVSILILAGIQHQHPVGLIKLVKIAQGFTVPAESLIVSEFMIDIKKNFYILKNFLPVSYEQAQLRHLDNRIPPPARTLLGEALHERCQQGENSQAREGVAAGCRKWKECGNTVILKPYHYGTTERSILRCLN